MTDLRTVDRVLLANGFALFLTGLLIGLGVGAAENPRAMLAGHLEGVMNGMFLVGVALAAAHLELGARARAAARWLLVAGTWLNVVGVVISGMTGASRMTPIAGAGHSGPEWAELAVTVCLGMTVPTMVPAVAILLWGTFRARGAWATA